MWLDVAHVESKCILAMEEYWQFNRDNSNLSTEWDVFKAVMRGAIIQAIASYRAEL